MPGEILCPGLCSLTTLLWVAFPAARAWPCAGSPMWWQTATDCWPLLWHTQGISPVQLPALSTETTCSNTATLTQVLTTSTPRPCNARYNTVQETFHLVLLKDLQELEIYPAYSVSMFKYNCTWPNMWSNPCFLICWMSFFWWKAQIPLIM